MVVQASAPDRHPAPVRIGCSGWIYKHWRGLFYPQNLPVKLWFAWYASEFDTVEINNRKRAASGAGRVVLSTRTFQSNSLIPARARSATPRLKFTLIDFRHSPMRRVVA